MTSLETKPRGLDRISVLGFPYPRERDGKPMLGLGVGFLL